MFLRFLLLIVLSTFPFQAFAEEEDYDYHVYDESILFIGEMVKITLYPRDWSANGETCGFFDENGEEICEGYVSNSCGEEVVEFKVYAGLIRAGDGDIVDLKTSLGEWCNYTLELTADKKVVFAFRYEDDPPFFDNEYSIYAFDLHHDKLIGYYFYFEDPFMFYACDKLFSFKCETMFIPAKPKFFGTYEEEYPWIKELMDNGVLEKREGNKYYLLKAFRLEGLLRLKKLKDAGLR